MRSINTDNAQCLGRLDAVQVAKILGFAEHDIPVLVQEGLLRPLGKPVANARKYFAAVDVLEKARDPLWLNRATQAIYNYWQKKNANKTKAESPAPSIC